MKNKCNTIIIKGMIVQGIILILVMLVIITIPGDAKGHKDPFIMNISPNSKNVGDTEFTMTITGANFVPDSKVTLDGIDKIDRTSIYVDSGHIQVIILEKDLKIAGKFDITVVNPGNKESNEKKFIVKNKVPTISSISPSSKIVGDEKFITTIIGTNFISKSEVKLDDKKIISSFIDSEHMTATVRKKDLKTAGIHSIAVFNPPPGGGLSNSQTFSVVISDSIPPVITRLGDEYVSVDVGGTYNDAGATALDNIDGDITGRIIVTGLPIDTRFEGAYIVRYNVKDNAGNSAEEVIRIVSVVKSPPPPVSELSTSILTITGLIGLFGIVRLNKKRS